MEDDVVFVVETEVVFEEVFGIVWWWKLVVEKECILWECIENEFDDCCLFFVCVIEERFWVELYEREFEVVVERFGDRICVLEFVLFVVCCDNVDIDIDIDIDV